jgi:HEAT repeat protein
MSLSTSAILERCENFTYAERKKYLVDYGRQSKTNLEIKQSIETLLTGPLYQQFLALETCHGSLDVDVAVRALSISSRLLTKRSIAVLLLFGTDSEILQTINSLPLHLQIRTIRRLRTLRRRRRRPQVIDRFLEGLKEYPERTKAFMRLLPYGSRAFVDRYLSAVIEQLGMTDWDRLATFHPDVVGDVLHAWALRSKDEDPDLLRVANQTIVQWAAFEDNSEIALDLVKVMQNSTSLDKLSLSELVRRRPRQVVELILGSEEKVQIASQLDSSTLRRLSVQQLLALLARYKNAVVESDFQYLTAEQRHAVFPLLRDSWSSDDGAIRADIIGLLPSDLRVSEARRHIKLHIFEEKPSDRIPYISLLPWEEAMEAQALFLRSKEADIRSTALQWQLEAVKYDSGHLPDALQVVIRRKNEQSPVRDAMLKGLSEIPGGRWKESHLQDLEQIIRQALDASDLSLTSLNHIQSLLAGIVAFHHQWAASQIALLVKERGWGTMTAQLRLAGVISVNETMDVLNNALSPFFEISLKKKDALPLVSLAQRFNLFGARHTRDWPGLLDTLEKFMDMFDTENNAAYAHSAYLIINILKKNRPTTWWRMIPNWIEKRSFLIGLPGVFEHIHVHLQPLVSPYLERSYVFWPENRNPVDGLHHGLERWTSSLQDKFATKLLADIKSEEVTVDKKQTFIEQLGLLSFIDAKHLINLANDEAPIVREAAIRALGRFDSDQGVPTLIEALTDERARIAIYSLRTTFLSMSKMEVLKLLKSVSMTQVTVAKEVVRLIGDLEIEDAFQNLLEIEQTELHDDVRTALFRALWSYLDRDETWRLFMKAAQDPEPHTAKAVLDIPQNGVSSKIRQSFLQVLLLLLQHPLIEVRIATLEKCSALPLQDPEHRFIPRLLELLRTRSKKELEAAADVVFKTYSRTQPELIGDVFREALKDRRTLSTLNDAYLKHVSPTKFRYMDTATDRILQVVKRDRLSGSLRLKLILGGLPFANARILLVDMIPKLHADSLGLAETLIQEKIEDWDDGATKEFELELAASKDEKSRRLALELLTGSVSNGGSWTDEKRETLEGYRADENALVAEAAWGVELPEKEI